MTRTLADAVPGQESGHRAGVTSGTALGRLCAQPAAEFADRTWGRAPLLSRADELRDANPYGFSDLLDADAVDELVSQRGLRTPFLRVARQGSTLPDRDFTAGGGVGAGIADQVSDDKLLQLFADGATMVLQGLHRTWPPVVRLGQQLAGELGHPVQVNAYVTPPQSRGFDDHYDVHDVFVLQVEGEKHWRIHAPVLESPLRDQPWTDRRPAVEAAAATEPLIDAVLKPGDCLYLPRGYLHAATALGGVSTHLTIGVHTWTRTTLAEQVVAEAMARLRDDPEVRASLALGADVGDAATLSADLALVRERLAAAVSAVADEAVAARMAARERSAQRAAPVGPLAQLRASSSLPDEVRLREHLSARLVPSPDGGARLVSRAAPVTLEPAQLEPVRALLAAGSARRDDLGDDLARRLLLAGVVTAR